MDLFSCCCCCGSWRTRATTRFLEAWEQFLSKEEAKMDPGYEQILGIVSGLRKPKGTPQGASDDAQLKKEKKKKKNKNKKKQQQ